MYQNLYYSGYRPMFFSGLHKAKLPSKSYKTFLDLHIYFLNRLKSFFNLKFYRTVYHDQKSCIQISIQTSEPMNLKS